MGQLDYYPILPIDFQRLVHIHPAMKRAAAELEDILQKYRKTDRIFWQNFLELFTGPDKLIPADDRIWSTLIRLRALAAREDVIRIPLTQLEDNNDRAFLACQMLALLLRP